MTQQTGSWTKEGKCFSFMRCRFEGEHSINRKKPEQPIAMGGYIRSIIILHDRIIWEYIQTIEQTHVGLHINKNTRHKVTANTLSLIKYTNVLSEMNKMYTTGIFKLHYPKINSTINRHWYHISKCKWIKVDQNTLYKRPKQVHSSHLLCNELS